MSHRLSAVSSQLSSSLLSPEDYGRGAVAKWERETKPIGPKCCGVLKEALQHDNFESRKKVADTARRHRDLFTPRFNVPLAEQRDLAYRRLRALFDARVVSVLDFQNNPENIFTVHEAVAMLDPSLATKLTVQMNLFGGTVLRLGSEKHHWLVPSIDSLEAVGCFALTELGYGNNAVEMETVATYCSESDEFEIDCPTELSQKYWITNGAMHAHWAVVFAQLMLEGNNKGVHPFLVRIRTQDLKICPGVTIEDMGVKMGCNGVDNAKIHFRKVRIPRDQMLDCVSQVERGGKFTSSQSSRRARFVRQADQLLSGRLCISSMMIGGAKVVLTTAIRYGMTRMGVGPSGRSDAPIGSLGVQLDALVPLVARLLAVNAFVSEAKEKFAQLHKRPGPPPTKKLELEVMILCCAVKPLAAWLAERAASICRERTGGQGFLSCNLFGDYIGFAHAGITAEGDSRVLWAKVTKELTDPSNASMYTRPRGFHCRVDKTSNANREFASAVFFSEFLEIRENLKFEELCSRMKEGEHVLGRGRSVQWELWMQRESALVQSVAEAFAERRAFESLARMAMSMPKDSGCRDMAWLAAELFGLEVLQTDSVWVAARSKELHWDHSWWARVHIEVARRIRAIGGSHGERLLNLAEVLGVPEDLLFAPIAGNWEVYNRHDKPMEGELVR